MKSRNERYDPLWAGIIFALTLIIFYGPAWHDGFRIFTGTIQDITNIYGFYPWDTHTIRELSRGHFPLWNPYNAFGVPHLANMQTAVFYPLNIIKYLAGFWSAIDFVLMVRLWLAGLFTYLFARSALKLGFWPAMLAGLTYMLSGYLTRYVYMSHINVEALVPMQLFLMHRLVARPSPARLLVSGLGLYCLIAGGFPEASLYGIAISAAYFLFAALLRSRREKRPYRYMAGSLVCLAAVTTLAGLLAAAQWLPFAEYLSRAWTYHEAGDGLRHRDIQFAISLLLPWFFGDNRISALVPFLVPYLGLIQVSLAIYALLNRKAFSPQVIFFIALGIVLLGLCYGLPPFSLISRVWPFSITYNDKYAAPGVTLCVALLSGVGLQLLAREKETVRFGLALGLVTVWIAINVILGYLDGFSPYIALGLRSTNSVIQAALLIALSFIILQFKGLLKNPIGIVSILFFILSLIGLRLDFIGHYPNYKRGIEAQEEKLRSLAASLGDLQRLTAEGDTFFPNMLLSIPAADVRYYDPLYPRSYVDYMAMINDLKDTQVRKHYDSHMLFEVERENVNSPLVQLCNLSYYVTDMDLRARPLGQSMLESGTETGPFAGWARYREVLSAKQTRKGLAVHAPDKLSAVLRLRSPKEELRFNLALEANFSAGSNQNDGVQALVTNTRSNRSILVYSRFINPESRPEDDRWIPVGIPLSKEMIEFTTQSIDTSFILLPGPRNDNIRDVAAYGDLRLHLDEDVEGLKALTGLEGSSIIYFIEHGAPRCFSAIGSSSTRMATEKEHIAAVMKTIGQMPDFGRRFAIFKEETSVKPVAEKKPDIEPKMEMKLYSPDRVEEEVQFPESRFLVLTDQYFPGWRAFVNGQEARIYRTDVAFRSVLVNPGVSKIIFIYRPWSFRIGLWSSLLSLLGVIAGLTISGWASITRKSD